MRKMTIGRVNPLWWKVSGFLTIMFFILLSDAILSDFVPGYIQSKVGSPLVMGLVIASSSVVGMLMDLIFPEALRGMGVRKLAGLAMVGSLAFILTLIGSTYAASIWLLLAGMAAWGIYYELDSFMTKQFVADSAPPHARGAVWGVVGVFRNLAYFLGPLIGASLAFLGERGIVMASGGILLTAYVFFLVIKIPQNREEEGNHHGLHLVAEIKHWCSMAGTAWPVLLMSLIAGVLDAAFWTTGTVVNDLLAEIHPAGGWFLSAYMLPSLVVGLVVAKWGIYRGKKKWAEIFLAAGGLLLMTITLVNQVWWVLSVVFTASIFFGLSWPLIDAVYSDFAVRMKKGRKHMIGMSSSVLSLAYVIGPVLAGALAQEQGELASFSWLGGMVLVMSLILIAVTPRKIRLPEKEIQTWD